MTKTTVMLAFILIFAVMFSTVYAQGESNTNVIVVKQSSNDSIATETHVKDQISAPSGRVRNIKRVGTAPQEVATETQEEVTVQEAASKEIISEPVVAKPTDPNDKRAQLNGNWIMEKTNLGLWLYYEFTGDDSVLTFDYSGPMGMWDSSYRVISYDGTTVKIENKEDEDEPIFTFTAKLNNKKLVISNIGIRQRKKATLAHWYCQRPSL